MGQESNRYAWHFDIKLQLLNMQIAQRFVRVFLHRRLLGAVIRFGSDDGKATSRSFRIRKYAALPKSGRTTRPLPQSKHREY